MKVDYTYTSHPRTVSGIMGRVEQGGRSKSGRVTVKGETFATLDRVSIIENRNDGVLTSVTVLDSLGRKVTRLTGQSARY